MIETLDHCPVCSGTTITKERTVVDHQCSGELFDVSFCVDCTHRFTNPRPTAEEIGPYYNSPDYISHTDDSSTFFGKVYQFLRNVNLSWKHGYVKRFVTSGTLLDYGCGTGSFMAYMKEKGYGVRGVELNDGAREKASKHGDVSESISGIEGTFDVITMWHVLEHIYDLNGLLESFSERLNNEGTLVVAVPNPESPDAEMYGDFWAAWDIPIHVHHFSKQSMERLMKDHGFELVKIFPMKLDSYYISLLSEQFKAGRKEKTIKDWITAFYNGFISNLRAGRNNTSSLIYIMKKAA
ncbi:MAG: hypothetical protein RL754_724 [Bacteroidota bacterium]|jgi:SAM-dependent methyltransferase